MSKMSRSGEITMSKVEGRLGYIYVRYGEEKQVGVFLCPTYQRSAEAPSLSWLRRA